MVLAPVVRGRKGEYGKLLEEMRGAGLRARRRSTASSRRLDEAIELDKKFKHDISIVVDRLVMKEGLRKRLAESLEAASQLGRGPGRGRDARRRRRRRGHGRRRGARGEGAQRAERRQARRGAAVQREVRLPQLRRLDARARAADLLVQLPARVLPALPRARLPARDRPGADRPRSDPVDLRGRARAVDEGSLDLPPAPARGGRRGERDRRRRPWRDLPERDRDLLLEGTGDERHTISYRNRFGRKRTLHGALRGHAAQPPAPLREHRLGEHPRADRGADGAAAVPGVRRRPPAAGEPRGHGRRAQHLRVHAALGAARRWSGSRRSS